MTALARDPERGRQTLTAERLDDGLVVLSFYVAEHRQNVITEAVIRDLADALDRLDAGPEPRGVVLLSARAGSFFAGADMNRLKTLNALPPEEIERLCAAGRGLFQRLSSRPWPTVAVIDGVCLGG
ncbi:MAG: enoyl-CoA hydratase-related protein, partial [Planctomycetia bacterium]